MFQLILISKESGEMPKKKPPKNSDNVKQHSSDSKTLYDTSVSDETASNSEESNSDSKGFAVKLVDSKLDTNLKELKELKMEVKPKITLPSEVGSEAAAAMSPSDNCFGVRRSTRGFSGGKGSPFQLVNLFIISTLTQTLDWKVYYYMYAVFDISLQIRKYTSVVLRVCIYQHTSPFVVCLGAKLQCHKGFHVY